MHTVAEAQEAIINTSFTQPRPSPAYLRYWMRIAASSPSSEFKGISMRTDLYNDLGFARGVGQVTVDGLAGPASGPATLDTDRWMCVEMRVKFSPATTGELSLSVDSTLG